MMLIKNHRGTNESEEIQHQWHINEPVPEVNKRVVSFQCDGDELNFILACMDQVMYDKQHGRLVLRGGWRR